MKQLMYMSRHEWLPKWNYYKIFKQYRMELPAQITVSTCQGNLILTSLNSNQQQEGSICNLYQSNRDDSICIVIGQGTGKWAKVAIQRIDDCSRFFKQGVGSNSNLGFRKYDDQYQSDVDGNKVAVLLYRGMKKANSLSRLAGKLTETELVGLAMFLLNILCKMKETGAYFGSFRPSYIYLLQNKEYILMGGQQFCSKPTSLEILNQDQTIPTQQRIKNWKYQPPEIYKHHSVLNYMSDLFVVGCILYEAATGQYPFESQQQLAQPVLPKNRGSSWFTNQVCQSMLGNLSSRAEPEQIVRLLIVEKGKTMFNTNKLCLSWEGQEMEAKPHFFNNFQEFIMKCTTETEGWFLYFCENQPQKPSQKYMDQILGKIARKNEKIQKLVSLIEKCAAKPVRQQGCTDLEDNSFSVLKMGLLMLTLLRRLSFETTQPFQASFSKVCSKLVVKKCQNRLIPILFKIIGFKVSLSLKFVELSGNFHITVQKYCMVSVEGLQYLGQYCIKIINYLVKFSQQEQLQNLKQCQIFAISCLCDQLYDAISVLLFCSMAMKKDKALKICNYSQFSEDRFKKIDSLGTQIVSSVGQLCALHPMFSSHQLYSINSDYYEYQEQLCLMYCPLISSYEYFYVDRNQYKGLSLPTNYAHFYGGQEKHPSQESLYRNRKQMISRMASSTTPQVDQIRSSTGLNKNKLTVQTTHKVVSGSEEGVDSNRISAKGKKVEREKPNSQQKQVNEFQQFLTFVNKKEESNTTSATNPTYSSAAHMSTDLSKRNQESTPDQSWFEPSEHDIYSYEWLKKTEKIISRHFQKPELDPLIYVLYEDIRRGLKLHQLIDTLGKNKKAIVDPNQLLFQKIIGSGSAGEVYIGKFKQQVVAIKKVKTTLNPNALKQFQRQVLTYLKIKQHPNLVSLVGLTKYNGDYFLLTQFCEGGSLFDLLHKRVNETLSWKQRISIAVDIAKGMEALHFMNPPVIHRDLKSLNVFMTRRNNRWSAKVADFGLSRSPDADLMTSALGTLHWMAPQLLCNKQYSLKVDVYSFAIVLWEICSRRTPYHNISNQMGIVKHVALEKGRPLLELVDAECPKGVLDLMKRCWSEESEARPYFPEIVSTLSNITV